MSKKYAVLTLYLSTAFIYLQKRVSWVLRKPDSLFLFYKVWRMRYLSF